MKKMRVLTLVLAVLLTLGVGMATSGCQAAGSNVIKIGAIMPMTGDVAAYGTQTSNAIKIAIDEVNKAGGVNGKQIQLVLMDDENKPEKSVDCYTKLTTQDKVDVIIGCLTSKCTLAVVPMAQKDGIPMITSSSTNEKVTQAGDYIFRSCFIDPFQGTVNAKFATETLKKTKAAIMFDNGNDYSKGLSAAFEKSFTEMGGTIVDKEAYSQNDQDYSAIIAKIKDKSPEVIFIPDYYQKDALLAKQIRAAGMTDVILMGGDGWDEIANNADDSVVGSYYSNHYSTDSQDPDVVAFVAKYKSTYNNETPNALAALGYDALKIVAAAIKAAGTTDHAKVRDAMAKTDGKFVTGQIKFDASRNPVKSAVMIKVVKGDDGKLKAIYDSTVNP